MRQRGWWPMPGPNTRWMAGVLCLGLLWASPGRADETKRDCAAAFANAQRLMRAGRLTEAKQKLLLCGSPQCPAAMHPDCQQWLFSVETSLPTVVFQIASGSGPPAKDALFSVDGGAFLPLDGREVSVDPGPHEVTVQASGHGSTTKPFIAAEGKKLTREVVTLPPLSVVRSNEGSNENRGRLGQDAPATVAKVQVHPSGVTLPVVIITSAAALAGLSAVYFGLEARADDRGLDHCAPNCTREAVDHVKREYLVTNLSIGLAAAGITTATLLFLINRFSGSSDSSVGRPKATRLSIGVGPAGFGPLATGTF